MGAQSGSAHKEMQVIVTAPTFETARQTTVLPIISAVALGHFFNDIMQSLIPAAYPLLKDNLDLSFTQVGLITFVFQGTASILQPLVGLYTDRRPMPYAAPFAMLSTAIGLILLSIAASFAAVLLSVALVGFGSAVFHPEAARLIRLAGGKQPGFAQSVFQVGGNAGTAIGPLAAAFIVLEKGQGSLGWFALIACLAIALLYGAARWYITEGVLRAKARRSFAQSGLAPSRSKVRLGMMLLLILMMSKFVYSVSYSSYYNFFLIEKFALSKSAANMCLFIFLAAVAAGTLLGGSIGDRIGRRRIILFSILGILPLTLMLPYLPLIPNVAIAALAGLILASAFPAMVVYAQDLMPQHTGMVAGLLYGLAFGFAAFGAAGLGILADLWGILTVYKITAFLPALGLVAFFLPEIRDEPEV